MAIIKCPECRHTTSDKAPTCPRCGVEIAGKVAQCPYCGEYYLIAESICPSCHHDLHHVVPQQETITETVEDSSAPSPVAPASMEKQILQPSTEEQTQQPNTVSYSSKTDQGEEERMEWHTPKRNRTKLIVSLVVLGLFIATSLYVFKECSHIQKENRAFEMAIKNNDPKLLENFIANFPNATQEHLDAINKKIKELNQLNQEWADALAAKSTEALENYLNKYPNTPHKGEIENMIDSMDWEYTLSSNSTDLYQQYLNDHPYGAHAEEAKEKMREIKAKILQPEEKSMVDNLLTKFFRAVNARDENTLTSTLNPSMTSFIGVNNPTEGDVISWMNRQYKEDVTEVVWRLNHNLNISKREVGENAYEYTTKLTATEDIKRAGETTTHKFNITAVISPDGKISSMKMNKVVTEPDDSEPKKE